MFQIPISSTALISETEGLIGPTMILLSFYINFEWIHWLTQYIIDFRPKLRDFKTKMDQEAKLIFKRKNSKFHSSANDRIKYIKLTSNETFRLLRLTRMLCNFHPQLQLNNRKFWLMFQNGTLRDKKKSLENDTTQDKYVLSRSFKIFNKRKSEWFKIAKCVSSWKIS
jgi:hypothetical protein